MIFLTVGTHEQQFDRLIKFIDELVRKDVIKEEVIMQIGYSTYKPKYCKWFRLIPYIDMEKYICDARIVITHGGPATFIMPLQKGKIPIVVPRQYEFNEHVNNHQLEFIKLVSEKMKNIIPIYDINDIKNVIENYNKITYLMHSDKYSNNVNFNNKLSQIVDSM